MNAGRLTYLVLLSALSASGLSADPRADAVRQARAGDFARAIPALEALANAGDTAAAADLVAVLTWADRPAAALALWSALPADQRPAWLQADVAHALAQLGGGLGARELAPEDPALAAAGAASLTRLATVTGEDPAQRFAAADRALRELDRQLATERARPAPDAGLIRRLSLDRWIALHARSRMTEIVAELDRWPEPLPALPPYALGVAADALLYLEQPDRARQIYRLAVASVADDPALNLGLFYAYIECEDFAAAYALIDRLDRAQPEGVRYADERSPRDNPDKLGLVVAAAQARQYGDQLAEAWTRLRRLRDRAPGNTYLRRVTASLMAARGWPRAALAELRQVETLEPGAPDTRIARADLQLALRDYSAAGPEIAALGELRPENKSVQRLQRDWHQHEQPEFYARAETSRGASPDLKGRSWSAQAEVWTPPLDAWRIYATAARAAADIPEGEVKASRLAAGLEWRAPAWELLATTGRGDSVRNDTLAALRANWEPTDQWTATAVAEHGSADTPLRALHYGIRADSLDFSTAYSPDESRQLSAGARLVEFTSGNHQDTLSAGWRERLLSRPGLQVDLRADFSRQRNSQAGEPYYSPRRMTDAGASLAAHHVIHRRYARVLAQRLVLAAGLRDEADFGSGATWSARYELRRDFSETLSLVVAGETGDSRYDGLRERFTRWEFTIHGRF